MFEVKDVSRSSLAGANRAGETGPRNGSFSETIMDAARVAGEHERGLPGRMDRPTCKRCGGPLDYVDASRTCTNCLEAEARIAERGYGGRRI